MKTLLRLMMLIVSIAALSLAVHSQANEPQQAVSLAVTAANAPVGAIIAYAGPVDAAFETKSGWMLCDGRPLDRTKPAYAALFSGIGSSWGGDGVNLFNLPDLRGRFLRGVDNGAGRDPDRTGRGESNPGGHTGDNVGSIQKDETGRHSHAAESQSTASSHHHNTRTPGGDHGSSGQSGHDQGLKNEDSGENSSFTITTTTTVKDAGGNETRPKNAYVVWLIRVN